MKILVTGTAGFIGFHLVRRLAERGNEVVGIDNINDYYPVSLKYARLRECGIAEEKIVQGHTVQSDRYASYRFVRMDLQDKAALERLFEVEKFDAVMNLAAQAGVRYSIENPLAYIDSNIVGFANLLEAVRHNPVKHFVYASSSSVYGGNTKTPFAESDSVDSPVSLYAATKKSNELMAHVYTKLYGIPTTGLRFFTVYGPWGRPDMAPMLFTKAILAGESIKVFNNGNLSRDFTYIDDIIEGVVRVIDHAPVCEIPAEIYNIGCGHPMPLMNFIHTLEEKLGRKAEMKMLPMQQGDVYTTYADTSKLERDMGYKPHVSLDEGIGKFVEWYKEYYKDTYAI
ncbi:NAD-dependent epimerase [Bacteroides sp.]|uniref:NAD-dependent epimerase n=1 Tax=Bacteroides sp. TaxID=29523 RepID=UPI002588DF6C|nr:NAD-dependent epimerase [Bacteroides sp.]